MEYKNIPKASRPSKLADLPNPPKDLFCLGNFDPKILQNTASVVGSRRMTEYGRQVVDKLVSELVFSGKTIISGFMYGVDQCAHRAAIENGGKTVAILGFGISFKLEGTDKNLAEEIVASGGVLLSEWENQKPTLWTFPSRNRLVAALSSEVYIVEAAFGSGSLITANLARQLNREVFAVPGPITSKTSAGTNELIASGRAKMWTGETRQSELFPTTDPILTILENESLTANEIGRKLQRDVSELGAELSMHILSGTLVEKAGKYYLAKK